MYILKRGSKLKEWGHDIKRDFITQRPGKTTAPFNLINQC